MVKKLPEPANTEEAEKYLEHLGWRFAESNNGLFMWEAARVAYEFELPMPQGCVQYFGNQAEEVFKAVDGKQTMERALRLKNLKQRRAQYEQLLDPTDKRRALWSRRSLLNLVDEFDPEGEKSTKEIIQHLTDTLAPHRDRWMKDWYYQALEGYDRRGQVNFEDCGDI